MRFAIGLEVSNDIERSVAFPKEGKGDRLRWMRLPRDDTVSISLARSATMFLTATAIGSIEYISVSGYEFCYRRTL